MACDLDSIKHQFFNLTAERMYAVVDGAACPELRFKLYEHQSASCCLWSGDLAADLQEVAPYLVKLQVNDPATDWLIQMGWDQHWSIFVESQQTLDKLRKQLRKLLKVKSPQGKNLNFRFYDPRVMATFVAHCDFQQAQQLFAGLSGIYFQQQQELLMARLAMTEQTVLIQPLGAA